MSNNKNDYKNSWKLDFHDEVNYTKETTKWINEEIVEKISKINDEPDWMLKLRLKAYKIYKEKDLPNWWPNLEKLDLDEIYYLAKPEWISNEKDWNRVPKNIKNTFQKLWILEAEKKSLSWVWAQYDSDTVYHNLKKRFENAGVIFENMNIAVKKHEKLVKKYFSKLISPINHKFSALHYAVWNGGTFLYIPKWIKIKEPLQSYFRMNKKSGWQFEHTLIILEDNAQAHYIEWCSAPRYDKSSLHAWAVEIFVWQKAKMRYSSVENWSLDTFNLNTKKAIIEKKWYMEWVSWNMWSNTTMLYPCSILKWDNSGTNHLWVALASHNQNQDIWAKIIHIWKNTSSNIVSKSISKWNWISTYRWLVDIKKSALNSTANINCDWLLIDNTSISNAIPNINVENSESIVAHEAHVGKISEEELFYLQSRWIEENDTISIIVNGFISPIVKELPLEYASEMNVLISDKF